MKIRRGGIAVASFGVTAAFLVLAALMPDDDWPLITIVALGSVIAFTAAVGTLIAYRRPENGVGWVLTGLGLCISSGILATQYANRALIDAPGSLPYGLVAAWLQSWLWIPLYALVPLLLLYFPTGRPPSPRWRVLSYSLLCVDVLLVGMQAFRPGRFDTFPTVSNPFGLSVMGQMTPVLETVLPPIIVLTLVGVLASVVVRVRRSKGVERQQLKYFAFAVGIAIPLLALQPLLFWEDIERPPLVLALGFLFSLCAFLLLPLSIGLAILRHRLYDIDRVVSRTVAYAIVTAFLGGTFAVLVLVPTAFVGAEGTGVPDYAVAGATLIVAALFRPLRRRIQRRVDRRFNRARYDATRIVEGFAVRLRQQIDIDALGTQLRAVVSETVHPSHVSVWIAKGS